MEGQIKTNQVRSLEVLIAKRIPPLLKRAHLNRDVIIGLIGDRGDGKSVGAGEISWLDWGIEPGEVIRSNMNIQADITVSDDTAHKYGLPCGGSVHYQSKYLDKGKFLSFSPEYYRNIFVIDEINIFLADARRAMSNQNLETNDVGQQLRKLQSPLIYTCIHEMFVDNRIRDLTDIFIRTEDTALTPLGLSRKQKQGLEFQWYIYAMTRKLTGERYADTHQKIGPFFMRGKPLWGLIDTNQRQERKKYRNENNEIDVDINSEKDAATKAFNDTYGWIGERIMELVDADQVTLSSAQMKQNFPGVNMKILKDYFGVTYNPYHQSWDIDNYVIGQRQRVLVPA